MDGLEEKVKKKLDPEELCWPQDVIDILSTFKPSSLTLKSLTRCSKV